MNIMLVVLDTIRADHLSYTGYGRKTSPFIDELAGEGVVFENFTSNAAHTVPAFTTIHTGLGPFTHGITGTLWCLPDTFNHLLPSDTPTIATILSGAGYHCTAIDNLINFRFRPSWFTKGFHEYLNPNPAGNAALVLAEEVGDVFFNWLRRPPKNNFFLFMHYWDAHSPYNQPPLYRKLFKIDDLMGLMKTAPDGTRYVPRWGMCPVLEDRWWLKQINLYDGEIRYFDDQFAKVIKALKQKKLYDDTMIIFTGDHGEDMLEHHCRLGHREVYQSALGVPLIIKPPKGMKIARKKIDALSSQEDLLPTIFEASGVRFPTIAAHADKKGITRPDGKSLLPLIAGRKKKIHDCICATGCYFRRRGTWYSVEACTRTKDWKLIKRSPLPLGKLLDNDIIGLLGAIDENKRSYYSADTFRVLPKIELYDMKNDPDERNDLVKKRPDIIKKLSEKFKIIEKSGYFYK